MMDQDFFVKQCELQVISQLLLVTYSAICHITCSEMDSKDVEFKYTFRKGGKYM